MLLLCGVHSASPRRPAINFQFKFQPISIFLEQILQSHFKTPGSICQEDWNDAGCSGPLCSMLKIPFWPLVCKKKFAFDWSDSFRLYFYRQPWANTVFKSKHVDLETKQYTRRSLLHALNTVGFVKTRHRLQIGKSCPLTWKKPACAYLSIINNSTCSSSCFTNPLPPFRKNTTMC